MTGEAKEVRGIVRDVELFDEVVVCSADSLALEPLERKVREFLGPSRLQRVSFHPMSTYLSTSRTKVTLSHPHAPRSSRSVHENQIPIPRPVKSRARLEPERAPAPPRRRSRRARTPLLDEIEQAYVHLHDMDWLQESNLARLPEVTRHVNLKQAMPHAQALRALLTTAAHKVVKDMNATPDKSKAALFLRRYIEGKSVTEIAREMGVRREWVSRSYRGEAFKLAGEQFVRLISREDTPAS